MPGTLPGAARPDRANETDSQQDAQQTADREQHRRFRQGLTHDVPPGRSEREANGEIVRPCRTPYEEETADVGAGHREQHEHGGEQRPQCRPRVAEQLALQ